MSALLLPIPQAQPRLRPFHAGEEATAQAWLAHRDDRDVYLGALVWRHGVQLPPDFGVLLGWYRGGRLAGVFLHATVIVLACDDDQGIAAFARYLARHVGEHDLAQVVSLRGAVEALMRHLAALSVPLPPQRLVRPSQPLMKVTRRSLVPFRRLRSGCSLPPAPLEQARLSDFDELLLACSAMTREELLIDPMRYKAVFCSALQRRIQQGREYIWREDDRLVFRAAVAASTPQAALIEGVFTPPSERRKQRATRAMASLCTRLLRIHDSIVLFVNEDNEPALRTYRRIGFRTFDEYQSIFFEPSDNAR